MPVLSCTKIPKSHICALNTLPCSDSSSRSGSIPILPPRCHQSLNEPCWHMSHSWDAPCHGSDTSYLAGTGEEAHPGDPGAAAPHSQSQGDRPGPREPAEGESHCAACLGARRRDTRCPWFGGLAVCDWLCPSLALLPGPSRMAMEPGMCPAGSRSCAGSRAGTGGA